MTSASLINEILLILMILSVIFIVFSEKIIENIIALCIFAILIALDCILLKANLVAFNEIIVGAVLLPLFFIVAFSNINKIINKEKNKKNGTINIVKRGEKD
ncbi:MAG: hypothetical protein Q8900_01710 [Bacillota bacterium]|nr:hypothetical protein [Bacillota bacterium]